MNRAPKDHWLHMYYSPFLVRDLSRSSAHQDHSVLGRVKHLFRPGLKDTKLDSKGREVDYGGADGSAFEEMDIEDPDSAAGRAARRTKFALSVRLAAPPPRTATNSVPGTRGRRPRGSPGDARVDAHAVEAGTCPSGLCLRASSARRAVGPGARSTSWTIVAQPDGTSMWPSPYSALHAPEADEGALRRGEQYLTYEQLTAKLDKYQELRPSAATG